jgi:hypothetical protein
MGLVEAVPELRWMLDKHLRDNHGELLPHVLVADIEGWAETEAVARRVAADAPLSRLLTYFETVSGENREPLSNDPPANVIAVSFIEGIPPYGQPGGEIRDLLGPNLRDALEES